MGWPFMDLCESVGECRDGWILVQGWLELGGQRVPVEVCMCRHKGYMLIPAQSRRNCTSSSTGKKGPCRWKAGHSPPVGHLAASFVPRLGLSISFHDTLDPSGLELRSRGFSSLAADSSVGPVQGSEMDS